MSYAGFGWASAANELPVVVGGTNCPAIHVDSTLAGNDCGPSSSLKEQQFGVNGCFQEQSFVTDGFEFLGNIVHQSLNGEPPFAFGGSLRPRIYLAW